MLFKDGRLKVKRTNIVSIPVVDTSLGTDGTLQELRIHKETERGDNDTIKTSGKGQGATTGQRCGGR